MGEDFVAFRDSAGRVGLLDSHCPHRLADLYFGRNEEGGLRCVYHGWKFSVTGEVLDMPSEPSESPMRCNPNVRAKAYSVHEAGGIVWAYLGPVESIPPLPQMEFMGLPAANVYASKCLMKCNYQQALEGSIDTAHLTFLHRSIGPMEKDVFGVGELQEFGDADGAPRFFCEDTEYGMRISARREGSPDAYYWRITQWLMPTSVLVPTGDDLVCRANLFIPIDDENCWWYRVRYHAGRPLSSEELAEYRHGTLDYAKLLPGTYIVDVTDAFGHLLVLTHTLGPESKPDYFVVTIGANETYRDADFGYVRVPTAGNAVVGDTVWYDYDNDGVVDAVADAIADHMGLWRDEPLTVLESQVLWDADKLAKIGLTAVFHWTGGSLAGKRPHTLAQLIHRARANDWMPRTVSSMHTAPARRAARARLAAYFQLYDALESELSGDDLV